MKKNLMITMVMVSLIVFIVNLSVLDAYMRIQMNYPYEYGLDSSYISFEIKQKKSDINISEKLQDLVADENIVILFENNDGGAGSLGIFDSEYNYVEYPLFIGEYFSKDDFIRGNRNALKLITPESSGNPISNVKINKTNFHVIGQFAEDYILYNGRNVAIYPLFSNTSVNGKFYIECDDVLKNKIISLFRENGYEFTVEKDHFTISTALSYLINDKQFIMMVFIIILTLCSLIVTDYALLNKKRKEYRRLLKK